MLFENAKYARLIVHPAVKSALLLYNKIFYLLCLISSPKKFSWVNVYLLKPFFRRLSIKRFSSFLFLIFAPAIRWSTMFTVFGVRQIFRVETQTRAGCIWRSNNVVFAFNLLAFRSLFGFEEQSELRCLKFQLSRVSVFKGYRFFLTGLYTVNIFFCGFPR